MSRWRIAIGLASVFQVAAGLTFFTLSTIQEAAPFGLALCAGVGLLSVASLASAALARAAIGANVVLAVMSGLGAIPVVVALAVGTAPPELAWNAIVAIALAVASATSAVGLRRLSTRTANRAEPGAAADQAGRG
jgi:hypothetical protein